MINKNRILWAVDAFEPHPLAIESASRFFDALAIRSAFEVTPVFMFDPNSLAFDSASHLLQARVASITGKTWLRECVALPVDSASPRNSAAELVKYASDEGFDAIAALKHAGSRADISFLGSFAENLGFFTSIPTFIIYPDISLAPEIRRISFNAPAEDSPIKLLGQLKDLLDLEGAELTFHQFIHIPFEERLGEEAANAYFDQKVGELSELKSELKKFTLEQGATCYFVMQKADTLEETLIIDNAKKEQSDLIIIDQPVRGIAGQLLGHYTRNLLRNARTPVLILDPNRAIKTETHPNHHIGEYKTSTNEPSAGNYPLWMVRAE